MTNKKMESFKALMLVTQIGLLLITTILIFLIIGYWIDVLLKQQILFKLVFLIIGVLIGFFNVYKLVMSTIKK